MDLNSQSVLFDPKWESGGPAEERTWAQDRSFEAMVALQKWLAKEKRESLPRYSVAKKVMKQMDLTDPEMEQEIDQCHRYLLLQKTTLKVCTGSSCKKDSQAKTGAKVRASLSLEGPVAVLPSPCMGHCRQSPCMEVQKGKAEVLLGNVQKEADFQKVVEAVQGSGEGLGKYAFKKKKLSALGY